MVRLEFKTVEKTFRNEKYDLIRSIDMTYTVRLETGRIEQKDEMHDFYVKSDLNDFSADLEEAKRVKKRLTLDLSNPNEFITDVKAHQSYFIFYLEITTNFGSMF